MSSKSGASNTIGWRKVIASYVPLAAWAIVGLLSTFIVVAVTPVLISSVLDGRDLDQLSGLYGDQFGLANAVISGLAFAAIIATIWQQKKDLDIQREELDESQLLAERQIFESTFFQMLRLREEVRDDIKRGQLVGRAALNSLMSSIYTDITTAQVGGLVPVENGKNNIETLLKRRAVYAKTYSDWYKNQEVQASLGHYFRLTYHCVKHVHDAKILDEKERYAYIRLLRAHLSNDELKLLYANCAFGDGWVKFMPMANLYHIFENMIIVSEHDGLAHAYDCAFTKSRTREGEYQLSDDCVIYGENAWLEGQMLPEPGQGIGTSATYQPYAGTYVSN